MSESMLTKMKRRLHWIPIQIERYISLLRFYSEVVPVEQTLPIIAWRKGLTDPNDFHCWPDGVVGFWR